ncbi:hypothetical protein FHR24_000794 [Wenyingzhuangia heitensis]|uniref:Uncharacterized protein n=1 Tax=Wenyingzhuangia heitensis TaxID=1487859 RepID=A0ABX0U678_9FLAO|nr:hypothetical protein [Wenyingzhuangia heitensis]NIJ44355.1 hypothetical protein [Wenyingzhuangia heitensis]
MKLFTFLFFCSLNCFCQNALVKNVDDFVGVDIYENYYYLQNSALHKSSLNNDYKNIKYGTPDVVDISNPLQVLLLYKLFNKVISIDNKLNFIAEYQVPFGTDLIASAGENKIWTYNNIHKTISVYNLKTQKIEIRSILITSKITQLKGDLNKAIITNTNNQLETYNFVARKITSTPLKDTQLSISMRNLYVLKNNKLYKEKSEITNTPKSIVSFEVQNNIFYYFKDNSIYKTFLTQP